MDGNRILCLIYDILNEYLGNNISQLDKCTWYLGK
jgi:hypothetical protein